MPVSVRARGAGCQRGATLLTEGESDHAQEETDRGTAHDCQRQTGLGLRQERKKRQHRMISRRPLRSQERPWRERGDGDVARVHRNIKGNLCATRGGDPARTRCLQSW